MPIQNTRSIRPFPLLAGLMIAVLALAGSAHALVGGDRGILAIDQSTTTCKKRFAQLGIPTIPGGDAPQARRVAARPDPSGTTKRRRGRECHPVGLTNVVPAILARRRSHPRAAQHGLYHRARCNQFARRGQNSGEMEQDSA